MLLGYAVLDIIPAQDIRSLIVRAEEEFEKE
jgi:hypothetical protein